MWFRLKKYVVVSIPFAILCLLAIYYSLDEDSLDLTWLISPPIAPEAYLIKCFDNASASTLDDDSIQKSKSIFFIETSCHNHSFSLNPRQACAVESAAKLNPGTDVFILVPSPFSGVSTKSHMSALTSYSNVKIRHINMNTYFEGTPLEEWYSGGRLKASRWPTSHASDILRYTTLWKYGGYYSDLDVVMLKSFEGLHNFVGAESDEDVAAGFLGFVHGHPLMHLAMLDLKFKFKGWNWGNNGPGVITRVLKKYCRVQEIRKMTKRQCLGVDVMPPAAFYAIPWRQWKLYFTSKADQSEGVMAAVNNSIAIHVWNYLSAKWPARVGTNQPYVVLASRFCPKVLSTQDDIF